MAHIDSLEWQLVSGLPVGEQAGPSRPRQLAAWLARAEFKSVLQSDEARDLFHQHHAHLIGDLVPQSSRPGPNGVVQGIESSEMDLTRGASYLVIAITFLHAFVQSNWTGPDLDFTISGLPIPHAEDLVTSDLHAAATSALTLGGEPAYHLARDPHLLLLAKRILADLSSQSGLATLPWWTLRAHLIHLSLLDEPVPLPESDLQRFRAVLANIPEDQPDLLASAHIELGLYQHAMGNDKLANQEFLAAARASGLQYHLTGALGRKTKYQPDAITQLILLAESRPRADDPAVPPSGSIPPEANGVDAVQSKLPEALALNDDTLLEDTEFTKTNPSSGNPSSDPLSHLDPTAQPALHPLDQSLLISLCLSTHNSLPSSGLTSSQMMPFISRVLLHPRNWSVHTTALLLRSRLEAHRSRTVERSVLQLAALIEQMPTSDSAPSERLRYFHQLPLPSRWEMERELAKRYVSVGVTRSALEIYQRLEMWEDAVGCLQRLEREDEAEKVVRDLLEGRKVESDLLPALNREGVSADRKARMGSAREGKLWCLLGDILLSKMGAADPAKATAEAMECYEKAWAVSDGTSSRSRRSLGSLYVGSGEFEKAIPVLQDALRINPLYARVWFTLGVCFTRLERWEEARDAFRRQVGVDEEDGEGWNNLAAVYLHLGQGKGDTEVKAITYENKVLAFRALRTGLRFSPTNWRMWANYMLVSVDVGELAESARALTRLIQEQPSSSNIPLDIDVLDKLVDSATRDDWNGGTPVVPPPTSNEGFGLLPIVERLFDTVILPKISDDARLWRCHARLLRWKEDWAGAMDDHLKAYRVGPASQEGAERDAAKFKDAAREIEELVGVLEALGPKAVVQREKERESRQAEEGARKKKAGDWKFTAKGIVRTFMGRTKESFEDTPEWGKLQELLEEIKNA